MSRLLRSAFVLQGMLSGSAQAFPISSPTPMDSYTLHSGHVASTGICLVHWT